MVQSLNYNDGILFASLLYSCWDLSLEWDSFEHCSKPVHRWLLASYGSVIAFRLIHLVGSSVAKQLESGQHSQTLRRVIDVSANGSEEAASSFLLDLRHKGALPRFLTHFTWGIALPLFVIWTFVGSHWLWDVMQHSPQCMPSQTHLWFAGCWLGLCYVWIVVHAALGAVAWTLERRVRNSEAELAAIEDDDVRERWGQVSQISDYRQLEGGRPSGSGLRPCEIQRLPSHVDTGTGHECPICLNNISEGDCARCLPDCNHQFHRSCIDLWLLRCADCPLCKREVSVPGTESV
mmetsp:Transcript_6984/g.15926  ORF Transcript_6984/g.15926 Transcript_6984/m.15926 type:complete len:292 (-) Transcript_6984:35-910(-)